MSPKTLRPTRRVRRVVSLALAGLATAAAAFVVAPTVSVAAACSSDVITDVDGGGSDVIVGLPSYNLPGKADAGAIVVFSNVAQPGQSDPTAPTKATLYTAASFGLTAEADARFGAAVVIWRDSGSFDDADNCADVIVGSPGHSVGGKAKAGQVYKVKGTTSALSGVLQTYDEDHLAGTGGAQAGAEFGSAIAAETLGMLVFGAPGRDIGSAIDAGHVVRLNYLLSDQDPEVSVIRQGGVNSAGAAETGDRFGEVLAMIPTGDGPILFIGVPHEDIGSKADAGAVGMIPNIGNLGLVSQDSPGAAGSAEAGDRYGASLTVYATFINKPVAMLGIGVPGEDIGGKSDAGMVSFGDAEIGEVGTDTAGPLTGLARTITQNSPGVPGVTEAGDHFGAALASGDFGEDTGQLKLVVTSPAENLGSIVDAGSLEMLPIEGNGAPSPGRSAETWTQDSPKVPGVAERGDRFGAAVSSVELTRIINDTDLVWPVTLVTVPGEQIGNADDAGMAYLGVAPGARSVQLVPPVLQAGAGIGMVPMQTG
jgi:hypothetical protein